MPTNKELDDLLIPDLRAWDDALYRLLDRISPIEMLRRWVDRKMAERAEREANDRPTLSRP